MASVLPFPSGTMKNAFRQHRLVILPDFQGLGIGTKLNDFIAEYYLKKGYKYFIRTSHLRLGTYLSNNSYWKPMSTNRKQRSKASIQDAIKRHSATIGDNRICYSYEYVGDKYNLPKQYIVCMGNCDKQTATQYLNKIVKPNHYIIIITGNAKKELNIWEEIAKDNAWRTEVLYINRKNQLTINASQLKNSFDAIILERENQIEIGKYRKSKEINSLITFNYKYDEPIYYEKIK